MSSLNIKINSLFGLFFNPNFELERFFCGELSDLNEKEIEPKIDIQQTEELWSAVSDVAIRKRAKEVIYKKRYRINAATYEKTDISLLKCSENVLFEPETGDAFYISDVEISLNSDKDSLFIWNIEYSKDEPNTVIYPLRSDYIFQKSGISKNRIFGTVNNPTYSELTDFYFDDYNNVFKFALNDITSNIVIGNKFAVHFQNHNILDYCAEGYAECTSIDANYVYFTCQSSTGSPNFTDTIVIDTINENSAYQDSLSWDAFSFNIYTLINPKLQIFFEDGEKTNFGDGIAKSDKINFADSIRVPFFLSPAELWKFRFLKVANEIKFYRNNTLLYTATTNFEIAEPKDNDYFEQIEFELNMQFSNITLKNV